MPTFVEFEDTQHQKVYVNPDQVNFVMKDDEGDATGHRLHFGDSEHVHIDGFATVQDVLDRLNGTVEPPEPWVGVA